jgi:hypothetical protein
MSDEDSTPPIPSITEVMQLLTQMSNAMINIIISKTSITQ